MPSRRFALHHKTVHTPMGFFRQGQGQGGRRDNANKGGPFQIQDQIPAEFSGIERRMHFFSGTGSRHIHLQFDRIPFCKAIENMGNVARDASAHQHIVDSGEHCAKQRRQGRKLDFFQQIDSNRTAVALLGQKNFHKIRRNRQFRQPGTRLQRRQGCGNKGRGKRLASVDKILSQDAKSDAGNRKMPQSMPDSAGSITQLQLAGQDRVESRSRDDAQVARSRHRASQPPARYRGPHPSLDNQGERRLATGRMFHRLRVGLDSRHTKSWQRPPTTGRWRKIARSLGFSSFFITFYP